MSEHPEHDACEGGTRPNKSAQKREAQAMLALGRRLARLEPAVWDALDLPTELRNALAELARVHGRGAIKRQEKYLGKLLRRMDTTALEEAMAAIEARAAQATACLHQAEYWRARLIEDERDALTAFMRAHPGADAGQLRQLIRNARKETALGKTGKSSRALFRALHALLRTATPR